MRYKKSNAESNIIRSKVESEITKLKNAKAFVTIDHIVHKFIFNLIIATSIPDFVFIMYYIDDILPCLLNAHLSVAN